MLNSTKTWQEVFNKRWPTFERFGDVGEVKQFISDLIAQTREETIREVEEEIESWEKEYGKSFTSDKIKNILNKLKQ